MADAYDGPKVKNYRVWHIPQVPGRAFVIDCDTRDEAQRMLDVLAMYDLFQYENNIKPDYSNAGGVMEWDDADQSYSDVYEDEADLPDSDSFLRELRDANLKDKSST